MNLLFFAILFCCLRKVSGSIGLFRRDQSPHSELFAYSSNLICELAEHDNSFYASINDAYSFQRSQTVKVYTSHNRIASACFLYGGYSYLIFFNSYTNGTEILRNQDGKHFTLPKGKFIFDNFADSLYLLDGKDLYQIDLKSVEKTFIMSKSLSMRSPPLYNKVLEFAEGIVDIQIANEELTYITSDKKLVNRALNGDFLSVSATNATRLNYIHIARPKRTSEHVHLSAPPFTLMMPQRPEISDLDKRNIFLLSLYIIDIVFFVVLLYIIKCSHIFHKTRTPPLIKV